MALIKREENLFPVFPSLFDDFFTRDWFSGSTPAGTGRTTIPAVNIVENDGAFMVEVAAPGMKKDDFHIELDNHVLTISAEFKHEDKVEDKTYTRREFNYTSFRRSFTLPENTVNEDKIKASYDDGVLNLEIPKREEAKAKPVRTIKIS